MPYNQEHANEAYHRFLAKQMAEIKEFSPEVLRAALFAITAGLGKTIQVMSEAVTHMFGSPAEASVWAEENGVFIWINEDSCKFKSK